MKLLIKQEEKKHKRVDFIQKLSIGLDFIRSDLDCKKWHIDVDIDFMLITNMQKN